MVQEFLMHPAKGIGESIGEGISTGVRSGLSAQLQDMLEQKQAMRQMEMNKAINLATFKNDYGGMPPQIAERYHEFEVEQGLQGRANKMRYNILHPEEQGGYGAPIPEAEQYPKSQPYQGLQPGQAPMLNYEDMPATEEMTPTTQQMFRQTPEVAKPVQKPIDWLNQMNRSIDARAAEYKAQGLTVKEEKQLMDDVKEAKSQARAEFTAQEEARKNEFAREKYERGISEKAREQARKAEQKNVNAYIEGSQKRASEIPYQRNLLDIAKSSLEEDNFGLLSPDNIAELTHIDAFRTPGGEAFRTAIKDYFLADVRSAGARPNMFLEKMLASILPGVGKSAAANMSWVEAQQMKMDLDQKRQDLIEELTPDHLDKYGNVKPNLINSVNRKLSDYAEKRQEQTAYRLQEIKEMNASPEDLRSTKAAKIKGTPLTKKRAKAFYELAGGDMNKAIQAAEILGYKIPEGEL